MTAAKSPTAKFFALPRELRDTIYDLAIKDFVPRRAVADKSNLLAISSLLLTCRQCCTELKTPYLQGLQRSKSQAEAMMAMTDLRKKVFAKDIQGILDAARFAEQLSEMVRRNIELESTSASLNFFTLPRELRDIIYDLIVTHDFSERRLELTLAYLSLPIPAIVQTSRQCCLEFAPMYVRALEAAKDSVTMERSNDDYEYVCFNAWCVRQKHNCQKSIDAVWSLRAKVLQDIGRGETVSAEHAA